MKKEKFPVDAEDVTLLINKTGTRGVVGNAIVAEAERDGIVWFVPESRAKLMSAAEFSRRLHKRAIRLIQAPK